MISLSYERTLWSALVGVVVAVLVAAGGCRTADRSRAPSDASADGPPASVGDSAGRIALPVSIGDVRDGDLVLHVITTGQVHPEALVPLRAEVAGTVQQVAVQPGQRVAVGAVLVSLDPYPFDLAEREAQVRADEAEQRYREGFMPESLVTGRGPSPEQRRALLIRAGLTGARLQLERARYERARATVRSPLSGVVQAVAVADGEKLAPGQAIATVVDTRRLRVEAQVLEHDLPLVRAGGDALVTSAGDPGRPLRGRIDALLPMVDSLTRAGRAIVRLTHVGTLRPGMYADVQLEATRLRHRRLVPARAVIERDGRPLVFVVKDGRAQWTYIVPGRSNGIDTEVLPDSSTGEIPVRAGDAVIVDGHLTITHDAPVKAVQAASSSARRARP